MLLFVGQLSFRGGLLKLSDSPSIDGASMIFGGMKS